MLLIFRKFCQVPPILRFKIKQPLTRGAILWNYPPGRRGGTGPWPHNMRGPTLCGAAPPLAQACGPTICEAPLYAVPLPPSDYIALDIRFGGERHRIFQGRAYSRVTGRCHPPFPEGTSFVPSEGWIASSSPAPTPQNLLPPKPDI